MKTYIQKLCAREHLTQREIEDAMLAIMSGQASKEETGSFLVALRTKGATIDEITGAARILRRYVVSIPSKHISILDTCGTGGDKKNTFNISTLAALVAAGAGVVVAKHGNRSVSSRCGSADVLEAMGINIRLEEQRISTCLDTLGIAFLFAQTLHPAMKNVAVIRKELGVATIFNILGPLTNPAGATHQILGVYSRDLVEPMAEVLRNLGIQRALVVHGTDGLDEITTTAQTFISEYDGKDVISYDVTPEEFGFPMAKPPDLEGGDLATNVKIFTNILDGQQGPKRDVVVINSAYALYISGKVRNINDGIALAQDSIDSGKAWKKLNDLKEFTNRA